LGLEWLCSDDGSLSGRDLIPMLAREGWSIRVLGFS
jgi:hypothetical protein